MSKIKLLELDHIQIHLIDIHKHVHSDFSLTKDKCYWMRLSVENSHHEMSNTKKRDATLFLTTFCYNPKDDHFYDRNNRLLNAFVHQDKPLDLGVLSLLNFFPKSVELEIRKYLRRIDVLCESPKIQDRFSR